MRNIIFVILCLCLSACNEPNEKNADNDNFKANVANPISYGVLVKNPDILDKWTSQCLENTNVSVLASDILSAVKSGRLTAYDYYDAHVLSSTEIDVLVNDIEFNKKIGKIEFIEKWNWDKENLQLNKKVYALMLAYESYDYKGEVKAYKASFMVYLNNMTSK